MSGFRRLPCGLAPEAVVARVGHPLHVPDLEGRVHGGRHQPGLRQDHQERADQADQRTRTKSPDLHRQFSHPDPAAAPETQVQFEIAGSNPALLKKPESRHI